MPTGIEWTHWPGFRGETLNPIVGCSKTSVGCDHCYAVRIAHRLPDPMHSARRIRPAYRGLTRKLVGGGLEWTGTVRFRPEELEKLERWRKPRCIFWCSMSDMFHPRVGVEWFHRILLTMIAHPEHRHIVLTKRPIRMFDAVNFFIGSHFHGKAAEWLEATRHIEWGVTAETQELLAERVPWLIRVPAALRFVSLEPLLGPVDLSGWLGFTGTRRMGDGLEYQWVEERPDWVIVGGETGPGARPMDPDWARKVRDDCREAGVPFLLKQMSGRGPIPDDLMIREFPSIAHGTHGKDEAECAG